MVILVQYWLISFYHSVTGNPKLQIFSLEKDRGFGLVLLNVKVALSQSDERASEMIEKFAEFQDGQFCVLIP